MMMHDTCTADRHIVMTNEWDRPKPGDECICKACVIDINNRLLAWADIKPSGICNRCNKPIDDHPTRKCGGVSGR